MEQTFQAVSTSQGEITYKKTSEVSTTNDYPYGRLRCTATFAVEFKKGKGFRHVFQTINPKNGRLNNPKKGVYYPVMVITEKDGFFSSHIEDFYGKEGINKGCEFMAKHFDLFSSEEIKDIYAHVAMKIKVEAIAVAQYCGADIDEVKKLIDQPMKIAIHGFKTGENCFSDIKLPVAEIEALKKPDFNPFKVTVYSPTV